MARVFIFGATGGVGSRLADQLVARGDHPVGLHRRTEKAHDLEAAGVEPVHGDLTSIRADALAAHLRGADTVVFVAGAPNAGTQRADAVDGQGVALGVAAATAAGARRFLLISAFPDAWRDRHMPPEFEHYMRVKRQADVELASSTLDWVILRPGTLTNSPGTGRVRFGPAIPYGDVSRDDVAAVFAELVHQPRINRVILELTSGETPIPEAIERVG